MPKITLTNTETGKAEQFEPVDAREILQNPDSIYEADEESRKLIGVQMDPRSQELNVPQLQGDDAEMQTGLSVEKYGRAAIVKAVPTVDNQVAGSATANRPVSTTGRSLDPEVQREQMEEQERENEEPGDGEQAKPAAKRARKRK